MGYDRIMKITYNSFDELIRDMANNKLTKHYYDDGLYFFFRIDENASYGENVKYYFDDKYNYYCVKDDYIIGNTIVTGLFGRGCLIGKTTYGLDTDGIVSIERVKDIHEISNSPFEMLEL